MSISSRVPKAVAPLCIQPSSPSTFIGPAISRCAHGVLPTNSLKNKPAVMVPPAGPPILRISATVESSKRRYSFTNGSCQMGSSTRAAASSNCEMSLSLVPKTPATFSPSATKQAPVRVAMLIMADGLSSAASESPSAKMRRPSASVL